MPRLVANAALLLCDHGIAPCSLVVAPRFASAKDMQLANVEDHQATINILHFGLCRSPANPQVAAATAAAGGVLTPMPCYPMTPLPWEPGSQLLSEDVDGRDVPLLLEHSTCQCNWLGRITIVEPNCTLTADY